MFRNPNETLARLIPIPVHEDCDFRANMQSSLRIAVPRSVSGSNLAGTGVEARAGEREWKLLHQIIEVATPFVIRHNAEAKFEEREAHPGWNIEDEVDLTPGGECRYIVELVSGQEAFLTVVASHAFELLICHDDDYDRWQETGTSPTTVLAWGNTTQDAATFIAPSTGPFSVIVRSLDRRSNCVQIRITAPPVVA